MAAATRRSCSDAVHAAQATLTGSIQAVEAGLASALPQVVSYRQNLIIARRGAALATAGAARQEWLHSRERPCPLLTQLERPPLASRLVPALRAPIGGLVTGCIPAVCLETAGLGGGFLTWVLGVPVEESATTLGITFANGHQTACPPMTTQWLDKLDHVQQCYSRLAKLPLSIFGRGLSSSAYGISKLLYHDEFEGIPLDVVEQLSCLTTKLVDRGLAPESTAL
eukprot:gene21124-biopygen29851